MASAAAAGCAIANTSARPDKTRGIADRRFMSAHALRDFRGGGVGCALVVNPADLEIVTLVAALEAELDIRVLGHRGAPVGHEHRLAVALEGQLLDEMRRDQLALG